MALVHQERFRFSEKRGQHENQDKDIDRNEWGQNCPYVRVTNGVGWDSRGRSVSAWCLCHRRNERRC